MLLFIHQNFQINPIFKTTTVPLLKLLWDRIFTHLIIIPHNSSMTTRKKITRYIIPQKTNEPWRAPAYGCLRMYQRWTCSVEPARQTRFRGRARSRWHTDLRPRSGNKHSSSYLLSNQSRCDHFRPVFAPTTADIQLMSHSDWNMDFLLRDESWFFVS